MFYSQSYKLTIVLIILEDYAGGKLVLRGKFHAPV